MKGRGRQVSREQVCSSTDVSQIGSIGIIWLEQKYRFKPNPDLLSWNLLLQSFVHYSFETLSEWRVGIWKVECFLEHFPDTFQAYCKPYIISVISQNFNISFTLNDLSRRCVEFIEPMAECLLYTQQSAWPQKCY